MCRVRFSYVDGIAVEPQLTHFALHAPWAGESFSTRDSGSQGGSFYLARENFELSTVDPVALQF